jgi:hypothetical protein
MRTFIGLVAGVLLAGLSLACSLSIDKVEAKSSAPASKQSAVSVPISVSSYPLRREWKVSAPIRFERLTIFPVLSEEPRSTANLITLDEGLRTGKVIVTELGANGRSRGIRRGMRASDDADVNKLAIRNNSGKMLVLIAGEMVVGGKQDRIVANDCIISSTNTPVPIEVFCVEHGRWSGEETFGQSRPSNATAVAAGPASGGRNAVETVVMMAAPKVREKAQAKKSQSEVWEGVSKLADTNSVMSSTGDLKSVYRDRRVNNRIDGYQRAFNGKLLGNNVVGIIAAVDGRIISADVFASHSLFKAYWPKMLRSYALEAISTTGTGTREVGRNEAESYLARVQGAPASAGKQGIYRLGENQSETDASFELEYVANKPTLIHFNRVNKR